MTTTDLGIGLQALLDALGQRIRDAESRVVDLRGDFDRIGTGLPVDDTADWTEARVEQLGPQLDLAAVRAGDARGAVDDLANEARRIVALLAGLAAFRDSLATPQESPP